MHWQYLRCQILLLPLTRYNNIGKLTMKYLLYILFALFMAASCGPDETNESNHVKLTVDRPLLEFPAEGGEDTVRVRTSELLYVVPGDKWITCKKKSLGHDYAYDVIVKAEKNAAYEPRSTRISVLSGEEKFYIEVSQEEATEESDPSEIPVNNGNTAWKMAERLGIGWNLGNSFDAHSNGVSGETLWGNPKTTQMLFTKLKELGFKTVRVPITWLGHFGGAPDYKIEDAWLDRVEEVVGYAKSAGLNVIINMHHDGADSQFWLNIASAAINASVQEKILAQITAMWGQIAARFVDEGEYLIFEAFNEVHDGKWGWGANRTDGGKQYACLNQWNQAFVDAVRSAGGENTDRYLGIPAYCTNADYAVQFLELPQDKVLGRLLVSVHCYDPSDYTLTAKYSEWGHTADASKKASGNNEQDLENVFRKLYANFVSKGVPVYLGEFGCVNRASAREQAFQQYYLKYYAKLSKMYGVPCAIWDNGAKGAGNERHAFLDHATGTYCSVEAKAAIQAMLTAYKDNLTLRNIYTSAPK